MRKSKLQTVLTKEMLEYNYKKYGSMQKMANELGVDVDSISKYMNLYNILYSPHFKAKYTCNHNIFSEETEKSFYLAGFIGADGCVQERKYSKILKITLSKTDKNHLEKIKLLLNSDNPINDYIVKPSQIVKTHNLCSELAIVSKTIFNDLNKFNIIPNKTFNYSMPDWLTTHPLINHFIRGYFDGDGTFSHCGLGKNRTVRQMSFSILGTELFVNQCMEIFIKNCNINKVKIVKDKNIFKLSYSGNLNIKNISQFIYKDATILLDRKYDHIKYLL